MIYPKLKELNTSRDMIDVFKGYNHNLRIGEGEFYDMTNLTSADYPVLSPRPQRGEYKSLEDPKAIICKDNICYVDGEDLYINEYKIEDFKLDDKSKPTKTLISMGAYIIIMPDAKYINTENYSDKGSIEKTFTTSSDITFTLCDIDGTEFENAIFDDEGRPERIQAQPIVPEYGGGALPSGVLWLDTSNVPYVLKIYDATRTQWTVVDTTYVKIQATGIGAAFSENDGVIISGIDIAELNDLNDTPTVVWSKGDDYIVVKGMVKLSSTQSAEKPITVERKMPKMDFIIESENRLWGCRYGRNLYNEVVNEIYASKLGDFKNWNCFAGISTDSYAASVGTDGQFTGAITHLGYPLFFKENCVHKVYGNYPSNYQIQTTACRGVQKGCHKSLAIVNEILYYKSRSAICAYDGSLPVEISSALGDVVYDEAVAGAIGNKYYVSMREVNNNTALPYHMFVYDTLKGIWHREDETQASEFCTCRGNLYYIDYADKKIKSVFETDHTTSYDVKWKAETGVIGTDSPDKKYISRLVVRMMLEAGTTVRFSVEYDSSGEWSHLFTMSGTTLKSFSVPIRPKRCDHLRLRIEGKGMAKIFSICKTIEQGSDV